MSYLRAVWRRWFKRRKRRKLPRYKVTIGGRSAHLQGRAADIGPEHARVIDVQRDLARAFKTKSELR